MTFRLDSRSTKMRVKINSTTCSRRGVLLFNDNTKNYGWDYTLCPSILKWLYTGLSLCIAILVYLGTGLSTSLFLGSLCS